MKPEKVFRRYDVRGSYPGEIDEEFAERLGKALGTFSRRNYSREVVVGKDTKQSSGDLKRSFIRGLRKVGVSGLDAGTGPTDYVAFAGKKEGCVSVQVTSSHLPLDTNGFKFMYPEGNGFLNEDLYRIQDIFREQNFETGRGETVELETIRDTYFREMKNYFHQNFDSTGKKVVVETLGGAATGFLPELLESVGAEVIDIASEKNAGGPYINPPDPEPHRMGHVERKVEEEDADLAVVTDMDADRVRVYHGGDWLTGDELFAILAREIDSDVVASIDTSQAVEEVVEKQGHEVDYTRVGDPFVVDRALENRVSLAGEPNGHYCFPEFVAYNSGILSALLVAGLDIYESLDSIPEYYTEAEKVEVGGKEKRMAAVVNHVIDNYEVVSDIDGIKFRHGDTSVLIRSSGSSPYIRIKTDSKSSKEALEAVDLAKEIIRNP